MGHTYGWTGRMLRINLSSGTTETLPTRALAEQYIGGRGLISKMYWDEVSAGTDALHPDSPMYCMTGPLAGTGAIGCSRWMIGGKSPLPDPDQYGLANVGGSMGIRMKAAGFDGIIITGRASRPCYIHLQDGRASIEDADGLWGLQTHDTLERLRQRHGKAAGIACIGPAGERLVRFAVVMSDIGACGGSGFGAVMGSKNLKAVVACGAERPLVANPEALRQTNARVRALMKGRVMMDPALEGIELLKRAPCRGCPVGCPRGLYRHVSGREEYRKNCQSPYVYYTWDRRRNDGEATANPFLATSLCDRYGLCTQETGNLLRLLDACGDRGLLSAGTYGIDISGLGTPEFFEDLIDRIVSRKGFGDALGEGTMRAARALGPEALKLLDSLLTRGGFNAHAYNPRYFLTTAVFYATESTSTMNQLHEVAFPFMKWAMWNATDGAMSPFSTEVMQAIARTFWGDEQAVDFSTCEGKGKVAFVIQNRQYAKETLVACDFLYPLITAEGAQDFVGDPALESRLLAAVTGTGLEETAYYRAGERLFNLQRAIQGREGRAGRRHDTINEFLFTEPLETEEGYFGLFNPDFLLPGRAGELHTRRGAVVDRNGFAAMMDQYYDIRGWDVATGLQTSQKMRELGLTETLPELKRLHLLEDEQPSSAS